MSFKLSNTYLKLFIMTAAASAMLVGSECLHRLYFDIVPLGRPWEEFLYLLTFTSILCLRILICVNGVLKHVNTPDSYLRERCANIVDSVRSLA